MRVVAGKYKSRPLKSVPGQHTRPTRDQVKESLFNSLGGFFSGGVVLDFYAGTGSIGIEAVSRGMERAVLIDNYKPAQKVIKENIAMTKEIDRFTLLKGNNHQELKKLKDKEKDLEFDLIFIDPPFDRADIESDLKLIDELGVLSKSGQLIIELDQFDLVEEIGNLIKVKEKKYGKSIIHFYERID